MATNIPCCLSLLVYGVHVLSFPKSDVGGTGTAGGKVSWDPQDKLFDLCM